MEMEGEFKTFIKVWALAITCLCYCYYIAAKVPKGILRLLSILPIIYLFVLLPWDLTTFHLGIITVALLTWLANFKLLLFCFDQAPLSPPPPNVFHFIALACLPITLKQDSSGPETGPTTPNPSIPFMPRPVLLTIKAVLLAVIFHTYNYKQHIHPNVVTVLYCIHAYLEAELVLALCGTPARVLLGFEIEPVFNEPHLATSLQDLWGRRWNLTVSSVLRQTIYNPVTCCSARFIGAKWAWLPAILASFAVSGLMHEMVYFYVMRVSPTWEVTWFFVLHGICVAIEIVIKKAVTKRWRWRLHQAVSGPLVSAFACLTAAWLFFPQVTRNGLDDKVNREYSMFVDFFKAKLSTLFS